MSGRGRKIILLIMEFQKLIIILNYVIFNEQEFDFTKKIKVEFTRIKLS